MALQSMCESPDTGIRSRYGASSAIAELSHTCDREIIDTVRLLRARHCIATAGEPIRSPINSIVPSTSRIEKEVPGRMFRKGVDSRFELDEVREQRKFDLRSCSIGHV